MAQTFLTQLHSEEGRRALTEVLLALFRQWELEEQDQAALLGLAEVASLWRGEPLPDEAEVLERAGLLLAISRALQAQFAAQPQMGERWVTLPNIWLQGRAPLTRMLEGLEGIRQIHDLLPAAESDES